MISKIKEISVSLGMKFIELSSVQEALGFYIEKEGFDCKKDLCALTYDVKRNEKKRKIHEHPDPYKTLESKRKSKRKTKKNKNIQIGRE